MSEHKGPTDKTHEVKLESEIVSARWNARSAAAGSPVPFEARLRYVAPGAEAVIEFKAGGKKVGTLETRVGLNVCAGTFEVPEDAKGDLVYEIQLKKHKLKAKSEPLSLAPSCTLENLKWDRDKARRGDVVKLTADVDGLSDGARVPIEIYEHDDDGGHELITKIEGEVSGGRLEARWEYEYHEDTHEIPTHEESEKGYRAPEYFFRVNAGGATADSGLLGFRDWVDLSLSIAGSKPAAGEEYVFTMPDGSERKGKLDDQGKGRETDVPPGDFKVRFPRLQGGGTA